MTRCKLHFCYGMLLAAAFAVIVAQGKAPRHWPAFHSGRDCLVSCPATTAPADSRRVEFGRTSPLMAAAACEDTDDDDEVSGREKEPASQLLSAAASPSRRATRMASSVRQQTLNTLNALCVRLQI